jgi:hypothetical protein
MDDVLHDLFAYHVARHAEAEFTREMPELARRLGMSYRVGTDSLATPERVIYVRADASAPQRRSEAAHEISHLLTAEAQPGDPSYEDVIRWYHPFWRGDRVPEPHVLLDGGVSLFAIPHKTRQWIGVMTVGEFDSA